MRKQTWRVSILDTSDRSCGEGYLITLFEGKVDRYVAFAGNREEKNQQSKDLRYLRDKLNATPQQKAGCEIICLCGSSRFVAEMAVLMWQFEKLGVIAIGMPLLPQWYPGIVPDHLAEHEGVAEKMDELHLKKINLATKVFITNIGGYIGDSTKREIRYAVEQGKELLWAEQDHAARNLAEALEAGHVLTP